MAALAADHGSRAIAGVADDLGELSVVNTTLARLGVGDHNKAATSTAVLEQDSSSLDDGEDESDDIPKVDFAAEEQSGMYHPLTFEILRAYGTRPIGDRSVTFGCLGCTAYQVAIIDFTGLKDVDFTPADDEDPCVCVVDHTKIGVSRVHREAAPSNLTLDPAILFINDDLRMREIFEDSFDQIVQDPGAFHPGPMTLLVRDVGNHLSASAIWEQFEKELEAAESSENGDTSSMASRDMQLQMPRTPDSMPDNGTDPHGTTDIVMQDLEASGHEDGPDHMTSDFSPRASSDSSWSTCSLSTKSSSEEIEQAPVPTCTLHRLPPEIRERIFIFYYTRSSRGSRMPALAEALLGDWMLLDEFLYLKHRKHVYSLNRGNDWSLGFLRPGAARWIQRLHISLGIAPEVGIYTNVRAILALGHLQRLRQIVVSVRNYIDGDPERMGDLLDLLEMHCPLLRTVVLNCFVRGAWTAAYVDVIVARVGEPPKLTRVGTGEDCHYLWCMTPRLDLVPRML